MAAWLYSAYTSVVNLDTVKEAILLINCVAGITTFSLSVISFQLFVDLVGKFVQSCNSLALLGPRFSEVATLMAPLPNIFCGVHCTDFFFRLLENPYTDLSAVTTIAINNNNNCLG